MNGQDVEVIKNELKHLAEIMTELKKDFKACNKVDTERFRKLEAFVIAANTRREAHDKEHSRISEQLGKLQEENRDIAQAVADIRRDLKKWSAIGGMISGGGLTGAFEILSRLIK